MTGGHDAFDALRSANPLPEGSRLEPFLVAAKEVLDRATAGLPPSRRWPRRAAVTAVAGIALATAGWTAVSLLDEPGRSVTVGCYAAANRHSRVEVVAHDGRPPVEVCADLWRHGVFGPDPAPALQPCVLSSGTVAVVPGEQSAICAAIGASPLADEPPLRGEPDVLALRDALVAAMMAEGCVDVARAVDVVERTLVERGFSGWAVRAPARPAPSPPARQSRGWRRSGREQAGPAPHRP
jgi:hypothetical protein